MQYSTALHLTSCSETKHPYADAQNDAYSLPKKPVSMKEINNPKKLVHAKNITHSPTITSAVEILRVFILLQESTQKKLYLCLAVPFGVHGVNACPSITMMMIFFMVRKNNNANVLGINQMV